MLVVTDLDGTLLDHHTYSAAAALDALRRLQALRIPVIFNTSKTAVESRALSETLGLSDPFIVENGSAIHYPKRRFTPAPSGARSSGDSWVQVLGLPRDELLERLAPLERQFRFQRLGNMPLEQFMSHTGLGMGPAQRARARQYSEPLLWDDSPDALESFSRSLSEAGLNLLQGGRFLHVLGNTDKGRALQRVRSLYPGRPPVLALGDSSNDIDMLRQADFAVIIRSPAHAPPDTSCLPECLVSQQPGPAGWAECVLQVLENRQPTDPEVPGHG